MIHTTYWPTTLQVKVFAQLPFGNQLFWFRETFLANQVGSSKILGAMATKMVATWRVDQACSQDGNGLKWTRRSTKIKKEQGQYPAKLTELRQWRIYYTAKNRTRWGYLAHLCSQSENRISFILHAFGFCHIPIPKTKLGS